MAGAILERTTILVIEDDEATQDLLREVIDDDGRQVFCFREAGLGIRAVERQLPDIVLLDLGLRVTDGFEICRRIRELSSVPIIAIGGLDSFENKKRFLEVGGNDYVAKPFKISELRFRIWANLRSKVLEGRRRRTLTFDDGYLRVEADRRSVVVGDDEIYLTATEYGLLDVLLRNEGKTLAAQELLYLLWGHGYGNDTGLLYPHVCRLRAKIERDASNPRYLICVPRVGYRFEGQSGYSAEPALGNRKVLRNDGGS